MNLYDLMWENSEKWKIFDSIHMAVVVDISSSFQPTKFTFLVIGKYLMISDLFSKKKFVRSCLLPKGEMQKNR